MFCTEAFQHAEKVVLETNWDGTLDAACNGLSVTDSDNALDVAPSDGVLGTVYAGVSICVADAFWRVNYLKRNLFYAQNTNMFKTFHPFFHFLKTKLT